MIFTKLNILLLSSSSRGDLVVIYPCKTLYTFLMEIVLENNPGIIRLLSNRKSACFQYTTLVKLA